MQEKLDVIKEVDKGVFKKKDIAKKFGIPPNTLSTILKNRTKLEQVVNEHCVPTSRKRIKACLYADVDDAMLQWILVARDQNLPLSGPIIREKAQGFAIRFGHTDFSASVGWLDKFKQRHNIVQKVVCGERGDVDEQLAADWKNTALVNEIEKYHPNDIFNADETGLFFKCLPDKTLAFKNEKCHGGKRSKERLTVMIGANMTGSEKLKLLVIGKSRNPRCFKGIKSLEVDYESNSKAWMTGDIYKKWLVSLNKKFARENRKILLFVDNCPAHPKNIASLSHIDIAYFPPNMTSVVQPMDQGIIQNLKQHYRRRILLKVILRMELKQTLNITVLDAIRDLSSCWSIDVKPETIANCFRKAGFLKTESSFEAESWNDPDDIPLAQLKDMWKMATADGEELDFIDYVNVDADVEVTSHPTDDDIVTSVLQSTSEEPHENSEDDEDDHKPQPSLLDVDASIETLRTYIESREHVPEQVFSALSTVESFITKDKLDKKLQSKITDFFTRV